MVDLAIDDVLRLLPSLLGGALLGTAFYGSLWWTVRHGLTSSRPALWFTFGTVARMALLLAAIYLIGDGHWQRLATCLAGFVMARPLVVRMTRPVAGRFGGQGS